MSKVYKCDGCEVMIENPHNVKMKEFYVGTEYDSGMAFPINSTRKVKIHLCEECFKGLKQIGKNLEKRCERCQKK